MKWILALLLLTSMSAIGQVDDTTKYISYPTQYGMKIPRIWAPNTMIMPYGDTTGKRPGKIGAFMTCTCDGNVYRWNGSNWVAFGGASLALSNVGAGHRLVTTPNGSIKTVIQGDGQIIDSAATTITIRRDTTGLNGTVTRSELKDSAQSIRSGSLPTAGYGINVAGKIVKLDTNTVDTRYFNVVSVKKFNAVGDSVTDDGPAIQAAINYVWEHGGGTISFPAGYYTVKTAIQATVNGRECNCQLYIPYSPSDSARVIRFVAENYVDFEVIGIDGMPVSKKGAIIASSLVGQADSTFILGALKGPGGGTFTKMNQTTPVIEGLGFRTRLDAGANGLGGFNFKYASKVILDKVKVDINTPLFNMPDISASGSIGMLMPERGNHAVIELGLVRIVGYNIGLDIQEHTVAQDLQVVGCHIGATFEGGDHSSSIQTFEAEFNNYNLQVAAPGVLWIANFNTEHYTATDQWVEFVSDINYVGGGTAEVSIGAYSASQSVSGNRQYMPTTNQPKYVNCVNCKFSFMPIEQFASTMLGENPAVPGTGRLELNNLIDVADSRRFWMGNNSGHVIGAYVSDDGNTVHKVFDITQNGFNPGIVNWMASTFRIGSVYSGSASDAKVEITTPDDVGLRINMSKTTDAVISVNFNRASTSVQNAFTWSTNTTNKWFVGQDNNTTDNLYLYGYTANKFAATLYDATADIGFGNSGNDLYVKNGTSVLVNTSTDNGTGAKLQVNGDATVADEAYDATAWNGSLEVPTKNAIRDKIESMSTGGITSVNSQTGPAITVSGQGAIVISNPSANNIGIAVDVTSDMLPRTIDALITTAQNSGTTETDLFSKSIAGLTLSADKRTINFEIDGEFNDNTATAQLKLHFGGNVTLNTGAVNISTAFTAWRLTGYIIRTSSSTAHVTYHLECPGLATDKFIGYTNLTGLDFTTANIFKITAQAGGAGGGTGDITAHSWQLLYKPAP